MKYSIWYRHYLQGLFLYFLLALNLKSPWQWSDRVSSTDWKCNYIQSHVYLLILSSRTKCNQLVGLFYLMLTFGYSEEWRNANILRVSREHISSREVIWQYCAETNVRRSTMYSMTRPSAVDVMREASSYTLLDGLWFML